MTRAGRALSLQGRHTEAQTQFEKAIKLANDDNYRENIKHKMAITASQLYSDISVIKALEEFMLSVVNR